MTLTHSFLTSYTTFTTRTGMMKNLPKELLDHVLSFVPLEDIWNNCLYVSRRFQEAAEVHAYSSVTLIEKNVETVLKRYRSGHWRNLREIAFQPSLPSPEYPWSQIFDEPAPSVYREDAATLRAYDEEYTRQIRFLFDTIRALEDHHAASPVKGSIELTVYLPTMAIDLNDFPLQRAFSSWRIHLLSSSSLPTLQSIRSLTLARPQQNSIATRRDSSSAHMTVRKLDYRVLLDISTRLPGLTTLQCRLGAEELGENSTSSSSGWNTALRYIRGDWLGPRRDARSDFADTVEIAKVGSLRHVDFDFLFPIEDISTVDQRVSMPNLIGQQCCDSLSSSLRVLSYGLRSMRLRGIFDSSLFWPANGGDAPSWPNLEHIHVMFYLASPSGSWYFESPSGLHVDNADGEIGSAQDAPYPPSSDGSDEYYENCRSGLRDNVYEFQFRSEPVSQTLTPFLTAFAKAAAQMQKLKAFELWAPIEWELQDQLEWEWDLSAIAAGSRDEMLTPSLAWGIAYADRGVRPFSSNLGEIAPAARQLWWRTADWRPQQDLHCLFQQIGSDRGDEPVVEHFDPESRLRAQGRCDFEAASQASNGLLDTPV
jgi:hypothetical protein